MMTLWATITATSLGDIGDAIVDAFTRVVNAFTNMILAIPEAIISVFTNWADLISGVWYGPIIAAITIIAFIIIVYAGFQIINWFLN